MNGEWFGAIVAALCGVVAGIFAAGAAVHKLLLRVNNHEHQIKSLQEDSITRSEFVVSQTKQEAQLGILMSQVNDTKAMVNALVAEQKEIKEQLIKEKAN